MGMHFTRNGDIVAAAERVVPTFHAGCLSVGQFTSKHGLVDRPHTLLWLTRTHAIPAGMYASQIWGTRYMKEGAEMDCPMQTGNLCFFKRVLEVEWTTCNWKVLREYGQEALQSYWFRAAMRFYNSLLCCNSVIVRQVLQADRAQSIIPDLNCWRSEFLTAFGELQRSELYEQPLHNGSVINFKDFAVDLRTWLCRVWNGLESVDPRGHKHKRTTYHHWFASPLNPVSAEAAPYKAPRYLNLDLGRHVQENIPRLG
eukprot:1147576-Pelagomonas_calceolata.AAC.1